MTHNQATRAAVAEARRVGINDNVINALRENLSLPEFLKFVAVQVFLADCDSPVAAALKFLEETGQFWED